MLAIRTILYATDFSAESKYAFPLACALARDYGARLIVVHVNAPPVLGAAEIYVPPPSDSDLEALRKQLSEVRPSDPGIAVERRLVIGDPAFEILDEAQESKADLIVMGTHGRSGLGRLLMGSVAEAVVRKAVCPVLTVKAPVAENVPVGSRAAAVATA
jgi:nucleotide-binding universal stress UspA family protein